MANPAQICYGAFHEAARASEAKIIPTRYLEVTSELKTAIIGFGFVLLERLRPGGKGELWDAGLNVGWWFLGFRFFFAFWQVDGLFQYTLLYFMDLLWEHSMQIYAHMKSVIINHD